MTARTQLCTRSSVQEPLELVVPALACLNCDLHIQEGGPLACQRQVLQDHQVIKPVRDVVQVGTKRLAHAGEVRGGHIVHIAKCVGFQ